VIIDAHHHAWDPRTARHAWLDELPSLNRPFGLADFEQASAPEGVTASVLVQVLPSAAETGAFLALADGAAGRIAGVVGWADLASEGIADELARLRSLPGGDRLVGIRHLVQDEPDPDWLRRPAVRRGLAAVGAAGLSYDLLIRPRQLPGALRVTQQLDSVRFVLDHGAKPDIASGRLEPWAALIAELARRPNVVCKLSGLVTEAGATWTAAQLTPYADHLLDCFGPGRLMFGSDWPVCTLAASYHEVVALARMMTSRLDQAGQEAVFADTAATAYDLRPPAVMGPPGRPA
jgi:L-fuconolactonase